MCKSEDFLPHSCVLSEIANITTHAVQGYIAALDHIAELERIAARRVKAMANATTLNTPSSILNINPL